MTLVACAARDEDALVCDFAQTYHILDWRTLPLPLAATLAAGLPEGSRSMRRLLGLGAPLETVLLAMAVDRLSTWLWWHTEDGKHGRRPPAPLAPLLTGRRETRERPEGLRVFASGAEWQAAYEKSLTGGETE